MATHPPARFLLGVHRRCHLAILWSAALLLAACSGGGGSGSGSGNGAGSPLRPWAIDSAASPALAADVRDLLESGDRYRFESDVARANAIWDAVWAQLATPATWVAVDPRFTFEFYVDADPATNWGRAFRYTGFDVHVGPVIPFTAGTYTRPNGTSHPALALQTWDGSYAEFLVLVDTTTMAHAVQNANGLPITNVYRAR